MSPTGTYFRESSDTISNDQRSMVTFSHKEIRRPENGISADVMVMELDNLRFFVGEVCYTQFMAVVPLDDLVSYC